MDLLELQNRVVQEYNRRNLKSDVRYRALEKIAKFLCHRHGNGIECFAKGKDFLENEYRHSKGKSLNGSENSAFNELFRQYNIGSAPAYEHKKEKDRRGSTSEKGLCSCSSEIKSFPPIADEQSEILVLGTVPGVVSLATGEYYAQKGNIFWKVISAIYNNGMDFPSYEDKVACLKANHIAVWDTLASCKREGSSDNAIRNEAHNDIDGFLKQYPNIRKIVFNGKTPAEYYKPPIPSSIALSTSPKNRQYPDDVRMESWRKALD